MNCSFCARDGVANAEAPNSAASAIPKRFPFIDSSIDTRKRLGAAHGSRISPLGWRKVQRPPTARLRFAAAGVLNVFRLHQRPWPPLALTFKLKMRKPREQLDGYRYWNSSTGGLVAIAVREGFAGFWDDEITQAKKQQRRLVLSVFPAHSFHLRATLRLRSCVSALGSCKSAVLPAHSLRLRPTLRYG